MKFWMKKTMKVIVKVKFVLYCDLSLILHSDRKEKTTPCIVVVNKLCGKSLHMLASACYTLLKIVQVAWLFSSWLKIE